MADTPEVLRASARVELGADVSEKGLMIAVDTTAGTASSAADAAGIRVIGINEEVGETGDEITAYAGIFLFDNSASNALGKKDIGADCYVEDASTVSSVGGTNSVIAGQVADVVDAGVYVAVGVQ